MSVKYKCENCGNTDARKTYLYDGCLGYEALVCRVCGEYDDHNNGGTHYRADDWSKQFVENKGEKNGKLS